MWGHRVESNQEPSLQAGRESSRVGTSPISLRRGIPTTPNAARWMVSTWRDANLYAARASPTNGNVSRLATRLGGPLGLRTRLRLGRAQEPEIAKECD